MIYFADTSAILNGCDKDYPHLWISPLIITELENIKTSTKKDEQTRMLARKVIKNILFNTKYDTYFASQKRIQQIINKYSFLENINDHQILAAAKLLQKDMRESVKFITSDGALYLAAREISMEALFYEPNLEIGYCGWKKVNPTEKEFVSLYSHPDDNIFNAKTNEFITIYEEDALKDIMFWDGSKYNNLKYKEIKNPYTGEIVKPRNTEQKMAFHLLQNQNIKVKLLVSAWGGGKTMLALNYALDQISKGNYAKIVFVRNNIIAAGTNDIGFLPGSVTEKLSIFARCIADHVGGEEELEHLIEEKIIETVPLSHIRGRSLKSSIILCDECENMDDKLVTLLMSRVEEDSEIIFCGDVAQIDKKIFQEHNGIRSMVANLAGDPLFGMVKLIKSERGPVAKLCDKMIPPN